MDTNRYVEFPRRSLRPYDVAGYVCIRRTRSMYLSGILFYIIPSKLSYIRNMIEVSCTVGKVDGS